MKFKHIHGWIALVLCLQLVIWASGTVSAKEVAVERFHVPLVEIGSVSPSHEESAHPEVSEAIYKAMISLENKLDLSKYQITTNEVVECYSALINDRYFIDLSIKILDFICQLFLIFFSRRE